MENYTSPASFVYFLLNFPPKRMDADCGENEQNAPKSTSESKGNGKKYYLKYHEWVERMGNLKKLILNQDLPDSCTSNKNEMKSLRRLSKAYVVVGNQLYKKGKGSEGTSGHVFGRWHSPSYH